MRWLVPMVLLAGCFSPKFSDGTTVCTNDSACPPSFHCAADHTCWGNGRDPVLDMAVTNGDLAMNVDMAVNVDLLGVQICVWDTNNWDDGCSFGP